VVIDGLELNFCVWRMPLNVLSQKLRAFSGFCFINVKH